MTRRHAVITWIGGPTSEANRRIKGSGTWHYKRNLHGSFQDEGGDQGLGSLVGRPMQPPRPSLLVKSFLVASQCWFKMPPQQISAVELPVNLLYKYDGYS